MEVGKKNQLIKLWIGLLFVNHFVITLIAVVTQHLHFPDLFHYLLQVFQGTNQIHLKMALELFMESQWSQMPSPLPDLSMSYFDLSNLYSKFLVEFFMYFKN